MNSNEIYQATLEVQRAKGNNAKVSVLSRHMEDEDFCEVLQYAMDPFKMFGIGDVKIDQINERVELNSYSGGKFSEETFILLDQLAEAKLTGNAAIEAILLECEQLDKESNILLMMILAKNLEMKAGIALVNKVQKNFIKKFSCMLAHKYEPERNIYPVIVEEKLDGMRVLAIAKEGAVSFVSREGNPQPALEWLEPHVLKVMESMNFTTDMIFDGEVITGSFNETVSEVRRKSKQAENSQLHIFHYAVLNTFLEDDDSRTMIQIKNELREMKKSILADSPIKILPHYFANSEDEVLTMYSKVRQKEGEGVIVKKRDAKYTNRRNHGWMKVKNKSNIDVPVVDWEEGTGEIKGQLGALIVDVDGVRVNVGSGFSAKQRVEFWEEIEDLEGKIIEVSYHEKTPAGSLRHPVFEKVREDKTVPNTLS